MTSHKTTSLVEFTYVLGIGLVSKNEDSSKVNVRSQGRVWIVEQPCRSTGNEDVGGRKEGLNLMEIYSIIDYTTVSKVLSISKKILKADTRSFTATDQITF